MDPEYGFDASDHNVTVLTSPDHIRNEVQRYIATRLSEDNTSLNGIQYWFQAQRDDRFFQHRLRIVDFQSSMKFIFAKSTPLPDIKAYFEALRADISRYRRARSSTNKHWALSMTQHILLDDATRFAEVFLEDIDLTQEGREATQEWLRQRGITHIPYFDRDNGDLVLYQETFQRGGQKGTFWSAQPRWARGISFRVVVKNPWDSKPWWLEDISSRKICYEPRRKTFHLSTFPIEVLALIFEHQASEGGELATLLTSKTVLSKKRQSALFKHVVRSRPTSAADTPKFAALVAEHTSTLSLHVALGYPPGWLRRFTTLFGGQKHHMSSQYRESHCRFHLNLALQVNPQCHSIFASCPRSLPPSCSRHLQELTLTNHHFHCFSNLMHLVWELPSVQKLDFRNLSWDQTCIMRPPTHRTRHLSTALSISVQSCPNAVPFIFLLTSVFQFHSATNSGILSEFDSLMLADLLRSLVGGVEHPTEAKQATWIFYRKENVCAISSSQIPKYDVHSLRLTLAHVQANRTSEDIMLRSGLHIHQINIILSQPYSRAVIWSEIDRCASSLLWDPNHKLVVTSVSKWRLTSGRSTAKLHNVFSSCLPKLWASGQVELKRGDITTAYTIEEGPLNVQPYV